MSSQSQGTKTMLLVNHAFARATSATFTVFMGSEQQSPCFDDWNEHSSFSSKTPLFQIWQGTKAPFTKSMGFASPNPRLLIWFIFVVGV